MNKIAAQIETTLYVFGQRLRERSEAGQTTAEYVGIVAFVAAVVILLIASKSDITSKVTDIIGTAFDNIKKAMG